MTLPGPFYHDFSRLGLACEQMPGIYAANQRAKEPILTAYILFAIAKLQNAGVEEISAAELFCADAYYAMFARKFGASSAAGFDSDRDGILAKAALARDLLNLDRVNLHRMDVHDIPEPWRYSVVVNAGGLYHVEDPITVLRKSLHMAERYLVLQTVVSLATDDSAYFETPAPGWTWGCRFSRRFFDATVRELGCAVVDSDFNELTGNTRLEDRGSVYYLLDTSRAASTSIAVPAEVGPGSDDYRAYVGPPEQYDLIGASQFRLLTTLGLREQHKVLDFGCGSLRAGRLLIPYLNPGNYFGVEPRRALVDDAFRFELGEDCRRVKDPVFSYNDDFRIPFASGTFDYVVAQSIFTHAGPTIAAPLLHEIARALGPGGIAVVTFLQVDGVTADEEAEGWVYPSCVGYTEERIQTLASAAGLEARRLNWYTPRVTWFMLTRKGETLLPDGKFTPIPGPVLGNKAFVPSIAPLEGFLSGSKLVCGREFEISPVELGFVDFVEQRAHVLAVHGWVLDPVSGSPAVWVAAAVNRKLLRLIHYSPLARADVSVHFQLPDGVAAGFIAEFRTDALVDPHTVAVLAAMPSGDIVRVRRSGGN